MSESSGSVQLSARLMLASWLVAVVAYVAFGFMVPSSAQTIVLAGAIAGAGVAAVRRRVSGPLGWRVWASTCGVGAAAGAMLAAPTLLRVVLLFVFAAGWFVPNLFGRQHTSSSGDGIVPGVVVMADVPFEDSEESKDRPMVVVARDGDMVGCFYCTSQAKTGPKWVTVPNSGFTEDDRTSWVDVSRLRWIGVETVRRVVGPAPQQLSEALAQFSTPSST